MSQSNRRLLYMARCSVWKTFPLTSLMSAATACYYAVAIVATYAFSLFMAIPAILFSFLMIVLAIPVYFWIMYLEKKDRCR